MKHGKKYTDSAKLVDSQKLYDTAEALDLCTKTGKAKFDETVEVHVRLGVEQRNIEVNFAVGDSVRVSDGYLEGFIGTVDEIDLQNALVRVTVSMMGKDVPVELEIDQIEPLN